MAKNNQHLTILREHEKIVSTRYLLSLINFVAILLGTLVTFFFVQRRGTYEPVLYHIYALLGINALQILFCIIQCALRLSSGRNSRFLTAISYFIGFVWVATLFSEMAVATIELGSLRIDLLVIAGVQLLIAIVAYFVWPMVDRSAIDRLTSPRIREDEHKRHNKSRGFVIMYIVICSFVVAVQAGVLFVYKMPPNLYDLFAESRAVQYRYDRALEGYVVQSVYRGTSKTVNIPAVYNNKPVIGIDTGALADQNVMEQYKLTEITLGTETVNADGTTRLDSNLIFIAEGAIQNDKIDTLTLPASIQRIDSRAIQSKSLRILTYSAGARFTYESFDCSALETVLMSGNGVGTIASLEGMPSSVEIKVDKDIYDAYRQANMDYGDSFSPILNENEFCVDFFTNCDYYLTSKIYTVGNGYSLNYSEALVNPNMHGHSLVVDTKAYMENPHELNTDGAKLNSAFRGWYTDEECTNEFHFRPDGTSDVIDRNLRLYAKWIPEYTAELDWGTYTPDSFEMENNASVESAVYWTDEDAAVFPRVTNRDGYSNGVVWEWNGNPVANSTGIRENITLHAAWQLDAPSVVIQQNEIPGANAQTSEMVQFMYDENTQLTLTPAPTHALDDSRHPGEYTYLWSKVPQKEGQVELENDELYLDRQEIRNYASGGKYRVTVTYTSPYGETASNTADIEVEILKKPLVVSDDFNLIGHTDVYDGTYRELLHQGEVKSPNIKTTYRYYNEDNELVGEGIAGNTGVLNAGKYRVEVIVEKNNELEASNYETRRISAELVIEPRTVTVSTWTDAGNQVYNGDIHYCRADVIDGLVAGESVGFQYENDAKTDAGTYEARITGWTNENYRVNLDDSRCRQEWTIHPMELEIGVWTPIGPGWRGFDVVYDGQAHRIIAQPVGAIENDRVGFVYSDNQATNANIGNETYKASVVGTTNPNYTYNKSSANLTQTWTISKRPLTVTFDMQSLVYNGSAQVTKAYVTNFAEADRAKVQSLKMPQELFAYSATSMSVNTMETGVLDGEFSVTVPFSAKNAGSYTIELSSIQNADIDRNYTLTAVQKNIKIAQKELSISVNTTGTRTYNAAVQPLYLAVDGISADDLSSFEKENFTSTVSIDELTVQDGKLLLGYKYRDVGRYPVTIESFDGNDNYSLSAPKSAHLTISPKLITIAEWQIVNQAADTTAPIKMTTDSYAYNKTGYEVGYVLSGVQGSDNVMLTLSDTVGTTVGSHTTFATLDPTLVDNKNYIFENTTREWKIVPYELDVQWTFGQSGDTPASFTYDGTQKKAQATVTPFTGDTVNLHISDDTATGVGTYRTVISGVDNSNYKIKAGQETFEWTITARPITLTWTVPTTLVYNGQYQGPSFKVSNLIDGESLPLQFTTSDAVKPSVTVPITENTTYSLTDAYGFAVNADTYTIAMVSTTNANYSVELGSVDDFTIERKPVSLSGMWTITNNGEPTTSMIYNRTSFTCSTAITSDDLVKHLGEAADVALVYIDQMQTNAGTYTTGITGLVGTHANNYSLPTTGLENTWSIQPKPLKLEWVEKTYVYNGAVQVHEATIATGAASSDDGKAYAGDPVRVNAYTGNEEKNAGSNYTARAISLDSTNYVIDSDSATAQWSIEPKPVTLTWSHTRFTYNGGVQYPTASYTYNDETVTVTSYDGHGNRLASDTAYTVTALELDNTNYTLTNGKNLSQSYFIDRLPVRLTWYAVYDNGTEKTDPRTLVYNALPGTVTASIGNLCGSDKVTLAYENNTFRNAQSYTATVSIGGDDASNYVVENADASYSYSVAQKPITIVWLWNGSETQLSPEFNGVAHTLKAEITGELGDEQVTARYAGSTQLAAGVIDAGTYTIKVTGLEGEHSANYTFETDAASASMTIQKQTVTVEWSGEQTVTYDGTPHSLTAAVKGTENQQAVDVAFTYSNSYTDVGSHTISITLDNGNYTIASDDRSQTLKIEPQKVTVKWVPMSAGTAYYSGNPYGFDAVVEGSIDKLAVEFTYTGEKTAVDAGDHTVTVRLSNSNYTLDGVTDASHTYTIEKRPVTPIWTLRETSGVYDSKLYHGYDVSFDGVLSADLSGVAPQTDIGLTAINAGTYSVTLSGLSGSRASNYTLTGTPASELTRTYTVGKQAVEIRWATTPTTYVYDGTLYTLAVEVRGAVDGKVLYTATVSNRLDDGSIGGCGSYTLASDLDSSVLTAEQQQNYTFTSESGERNKTLIITEANAKVLWYLDGTLLPDNVANVTYTGQDHILSYQIVDAANPSLILVNDPSLAVTGKDAGTYSLSVSEAPANYTFGADSGYLTATLTVAA